MLVACHIVRIGHREEPARLARLYKEVTNGADVALSRARRADTALASIHERGLTTHTHHSGVQMPVRLSP